MIPIQSTLPPILPGTAQLQSLGQSVGSVDAQGVKSVAAEFEAVFASLLLKHMRDTIGGDGLFSGENSDVYGGLFDMYMGRHLAQSGGLGIGKMVEQYLEAANIQ
jgi:flagellar protein FlgJ